MDQYEVIGIQHKKGNYNGQDYDNMVFYVTSPANADNGDIGLIASVIKIKTSLVETVPSIGDLISPLYDRFGRVVGLLYIDR